MRIVLLLLLIHTHMYICIYDVVQRETQIRQAL